jgi:hypothetical protein
MPLQTYLLQLGPTAFSSTSQNCLHQIGSKPLYHEPVGIISYSNCKIIPGPQRLMSFYKVKCM